MRDGIVAHACSRKLLKGTCGRGVEWDGVGVWRVTRPGMAWRETNGLSCPGLARPDTHIVQQCLMAGVAHVLAPGGHQGQAQDNAANCRRDGHDGDLQIAISPHPSCIARLAEAVAACPVVTLAVPAGACRGAALAEVASHTLASAVAAGTVAAVAVDAVALSRTVQPKAVRHAAANVWQATSTVFGTAAVLRAHGRATV